MTTLVGRMPLNVSEAFFQSAVIDVARLRQWRVTHFRPARSNGGWRTPIEGDPGCPDLILARAGRVLLAELKRHGAYPTQGQKLWLAAAGEHGRLWRPSDWEQILEELR